MIIFKIAALIVSLLILLYGAQKIKTEIGGWGFLGFISALIWLFIE